MRTWNAPPIRTPSSQPRGGVSPWERYPRSHLKSSRTWWHGANQPLANGHGSEPSPDREGAVFRNPQPRAALAVNRTSCTVSDSQFAENKMDAIRRPYIMYGFGAATFPRCAGSPSSLDRKSTRLNSSHLGISYAVF